MSTTVRDAGDWLVGLGAVCAALAAVWLVLRFTVLVPLKLWLERELIEPLDDRLRKVEASVDAHVKGHRRR